MEREKYFCQKARKNCKNKLFLGLIILISLCFFGCKTNEQQLIEDTKRAEEGIKKDSRIKELDDLCSQLPKPEKFQLVGKSKGFNSVVISHFYTSPHIYFEEIKTFYDRYFLENGWNGYTSSGLNGREFLIFEKDNYRIDIEESLKPGTKYSFTCKNLTARY
ncbi:MAG TPA: hypothetical protein VNB22_03445 [Pyrinomonadaceae bacterium]|jgi:hypothetical protein|nr:hypothetical protein [Pyrinomonadaceae bacterium]